MLREKEVALYIKREDTIHPLISGNKYRKLKYNLIEAKNKGHNTLLTFGGAFSNHIAAVACVGKEQDFKTIGVIRGEELEDRWQENPTLKLAHQHGMQFHFVSRSAYREKNTLQNFINQLTRAPLVSFYLRTRRRHQCLRPLKGCEEILNGDLMHRFDFDL